MPNISPDKDSLLAYTDPDTNYGAHTDIGPVIMYAAGEKVYLYRAIMEFDVSELVGETIVSAQLNYIVTAYYGAGDGTVYRCTRPGDWPEDEVTWNEYAGGQSWTAGGGDFDEVTPTPVGFAVQNLGSRMLTGLKGFVDDAIANRNNILSFIMKLDDENPEVNVGMLFHSRDTAAPANRPYLVVAIEGETRRFGAVPSHELVPNDFGADERRFGAVPSDEQVAADFSADERRFGSVPTDESVPDDLT